jgi:hypothetical protein
MMDYFVIFGIVYLTWLVNSMICVYMSNKTCDKWAEATGWRYDVGEIFDHHSAFKLSSWLGFRHWFKPYPLPTKEK